MKNGVSGTAADRSKELGIVICKDCDEVIGTLPMDGVKKIHSVCQGTNCKNHNQKIAGESV